ncbi:effector-associated constant component EACC1, partial [Pseudonocardia spinosispora]|uniref:effector-associated constant component EACC1 n=1 Tax=Pseudonocardia spinosispora TaxID=103441 RepID=UPI003CCBDDE7
MAEQASLGAWLRRQDELVGRIRPIPRPPAPEDMGSLFDVLAVAVGTGGTLTVLAHSLEVWL